MAKAKFITIEGIEGAGKSTIIQSIEEFLDEKNIPFIITREPGGTPVAERLRHILLTPGDENITEITELLLMFAARAQNINNVIKPALAKGQWVICDRFTDASFAYQGAGRGMSLEKIEQLQQWVQGDFRPDRILLLDVPVELGLARARRRSAPDRFEAEQMQFFQRVRQAYLERAQQYPDLYRRIDATHDLEQVKQHMLTALAELIEVTI